MEEKKISTARDLRTALKETIDRVLLEAKPPVTNPGKIEKGQSLLLDDDPEKKTDDVRTEPSPPDEETLEAGDVTADKVIEKLNTIRAGKSFKDSAIKGALEKYINDLDKAEKTALYAFLKGLAQVMTGEIQPPETTDPSSPPAHVSMQKKSPAGKKTVVKKPVIIRKPAGGGGKTAKKPEEDTTPPIVAKGK